jgi:hypothetical protein
MGGGMYVLPRITSTRGMFGETCGHAYRVVIYYR